MSLDVIHLLEKEKYTIMYKTSEREILSSIYLVKSDINCVHLSTQQQLLPYAHSDTDTSRTTNTPA